MWKPRGFGTPGSSSGTGAKATATTRCQKCLTYGHFTYECKQKHHIYKPRPSRSQQLKNPKLAQKLQEVSQDKEDKMKEALIELKLKEAEEEAETKPHRKERQPSASSSASYSSSPSD